MPESLNDRMMDATECLVAIADFMGDGAAARKAIVELVAEAPEAHETMRLKLLRDLRDMWAGWQKVNLPTRIILPAPLRALVEFKLVLRPSGLAAVSDDDLETVVISPDRPELELAPRLFERAVEHEGGNGRYSRHLRTLMLEAGFTRTEGIAHAPEVYGDLERTRWFAEFAVGLFSAPDMAKVIVDEGWATRTELDAVLAALREWGELPNAFAAWLYCGALGWVD